ncbi:hypothetical protein BDZ97DRAFT_2058653 [Flammula alnicola]|nr:hypothetical protein BDZ97DRAFT_2058653 [Flammula alnicola]
MTESLFEPSIFIKPMAVPLRPSFDRHSLLLIPLPPSGYSFIKLHKAVPMGRTCEKCQRQANNRCAGCSQAWYCSEKCQRYHWVEHIFDCNPKRQVTTADHLALACRKNLFPDHGQTTVDYGFIRAWSIENQKNLLGLYIGLLERQGVKAKTLHRWRVNGILIQEIKNQFEKIPLASRGGYYPWFLENQWVLDGQEAPEEAEEKVAEMVRLGWLYSGGSPSATATEIKNITTSWPLRKHECLRMSALLLSQLHPGPYDELWIPFGFCTCDEESELDLGVLYKGLLRSSTFEEFYVAYDSSKLGDLFRSKGFGHDLSQHPFLEDVLARSPISNLSVWDLKQFILLDSAGDPHQPGASISVDYGFINCKSRDEVEDLKAVYKAFFGRYTHNPPELHHACIEGRLYEYVGGVVKLTGKKKYKRLMKNPYPLSPQPDHAGITFSGPPTQSRKEA